MLIDEIKAGETESLEFKRDVPTNALKILKTACAFANGNGGCIVVGVDDDATIVGVDELGAFRLADQIVDRISNACEPQIPVSSEVATVEGKTVVLLRVQMGLHGPYYVKSLSKEQGTFVRVGATSRVADEDTVKELELVGCGRCFDSMVCRGLSVAKTEIDRLCSRMYRLARANCDSEAEKRKVKKVTPVQLEDWGVLVRSGNRLLPSHAFALLVGARSFHAEVRCGFFRGTTRANFIDQKDFQGSVLDQLEQAYGFVLSKLNCSLQIVGTQSRNVYEIPPDAIRELLVNAVVHRLYVNPRAADIMVAVYDDRVEVTSPGGLPHGLTLKMMMTGHSRSRNKALALAFRYMRFIESWGSGIPRIQAKLLERGLKPLAVENNGLDMRFTIWRSIGGTAGVRNGTVLDYDSTVLCHDGTVLPCANTVQKNECIAGWTLGELPPMLQRLVRALRHDTLGSRELCMRLHQKSRGALMQTYLRPAMKRGLVEVSGGKTHSSKRTYRIAPKPKA